MTYRKVLNLFMILILSVFVMSCAKEVRKPVSKLDTPAHHTFTGMKLMEQEKYNEAQQEFDLALQLNPKYSEAYAGSGLVKAYQGQFEDAFALMKKAKRYAKTDKEEVVYHVGRIRLYTLSREDEDWLEEAEDEFEDAIDINPDSSAAYYYMGEAYKTGLDFIKAGQMFAKVIELDRDYTKEAQSEWELMQKIQRAMPGTRTGKQIALVEKINRADIAALFMEEFKIDEIYDRLGVKTYDTSFKDPEKFNEIKEKAPITATDIAESPLRNDILGILRIGVRGLEVYPDGKFYPNELITRAAYALMIEDVLLKVAGEKGKGLATKFIGSESPFPDLRNDLPYFNAVMVVTSRGIMEAQDLTTGEFRPDNSVSGADALLIIKNLKEELKFF